MKISKLFHSLYALLMLAPVFAVGGAMAFNILNPNSVQNVETEDITINQSEYVYQTNNVSSIDDLVVGNIYHFRFDSYGLSSATNILETKGVFNALGEDFTIYNVEADSDSSLTLSYYRYNQVWIVRLQLSSSYWVGLPKVDGRYFDFDAVYSTPFADIPTFLTISICDMTNIPLTTTTQSYTIVTNGVNTDLQDTFYSALDSMNNSEVFSWAKTSFLAEPFSYIFGLFGIPSGSPFISLLSYWLSISIIWLVFDLVMYVPLLVHGWIDKGGIE